MTHDPLMKGTQLEERIGAYFRLNGYDVQQNVIAEGKSGARHEIDVLAKKSDGITEFVIAVECKAWEKPIEKDVVSKLSMVVQDAGINKGLIVALQGWRLGAEQTAAQLGLELWGPEDIARRLGALSVAELHTPNTRMLEAVATVNASPDQLQLLLAAQSKGILGFSREEVVWAKLVWIPYHLLEMRCSTVVKDFLRRATTKVTVIWNLYSALDGHFFQRLALAPDLSEVAALAFVPPRTKPKVVTAQLLGANKKFQALVAAPAKDRQRQKLEELGIPLPLDNLSVDQATLVYYPFYVGLLRRRGQDRLAAINAVTRTACEITGKSLTDNMAFVRAAVE